MRKDKNQRTEIKLSRNNGSAAYDLSLFEPRKAKIVDIKPNKKQQKIERKAMTVKQTINTVAVLLVSVFAVAFFGLNIACRVNLTEMETEIIECEEELTKLNSENVRLTDELIRETSNKNVEEYARDVLGMEKIQSNQIEYYTVNESDKIVVNGQAPSFIDKIINEVKEFFS